MTQQNGDTVSLKNHMEKSVYSILDDLAKKHDFCTCSRCRSDMMAYALNHLPPKYVVTHEGEVYTKTQYLQQQFEVDITVALTEAIEIVRENPRHD